MSYKYILDLRSRPKLTEDIDSKHAAFIEECKSLPSPWSLNKGEISVSDIKGELSAIADISQVLGKGFNGEIVYQLRSESYLRDAAQFDDNLGIEFNPKKIEFSILVNQVLPILIDAFDCYRATIYEKTIARRDWREIVKHCRDSGSDVNGRDGVFRINAVNYFDRELCLRAFGLSPEEIESKLTGNVEKVEIIGDGVYILVTSDVLNSEEIEQLDSNIKAFLGDN
jgi:hypothetical protein